MASTDQNMSTEPGDETTPLSPDDAFGVLGNQTRMEILQTLSRADGPLSFSELCDRVGVSGSGQFNYHLGELTGHFVKNAENGYLLDDPGRRVIEAILSGATTDTPRVEPTEIDFDCHHCGAPVEVSYDRGTMQMSCSACSGHFSTESQEGGTNLR